MSLADRIPDEDAVQAVVSLLAPHVSNAYDKGHAHGFEDALEAVRAVHAMHPAARVDQILDALLAAHEQEKG